MEEGKEIQHVLEKEAYAQIEKGEYQSAATLLHDFLRRYGNFIEDKQKSILHSELGTLYFWLGDYAGAQQNCEKALTYGDNNDQAYSILGKIAVAQFRFAQARMHFSKISEGNPAKPLGFCLVSIKLRDKTAAESYLRQAATQTSKSDPEYKLYAAYVQLLRGDTEGSVQEARALKQKCERDPVLFLLIAEIFMTAGYYGEANAIAQQLIVKCPENDYPYAILAHAAYADEDFDNAKRYAEMSLRYNPRNFYAKTILMKLAVRNGTYDIAEKLGEEILQESPEYSLGHANLGDVYFNQGRYELAEVEYEQTMGLMDSQTKGAQLRSARMKFIKGDYRGAAEMLEKLIDAYHTYYDDAMCDLALCYEALNDEEKKQALMDKMEMRRAFYHRTEKLLQSFAAK